MAAFKDKNGKWYVSFRYTNWKGERKQKLKRGFTTRREALEWEREFLQQSTADLTMTFEAFVKIYINDMKNRIRQHTWQTKMSIINQKLLPYFKDKKVSEITPKDVIQWQNEMLSYRDENGKAYSPVYLKTLHNQLSAIFNHAVRYYELKSNPAARAGNMGREKTSEMLFWTKDEYLQFADAMMDKPISFYAFEMLYWCGLRLGELLALTPADFDFSNGTVTINKSYQRIGGKDIITEPKTPKSNRVITMPSFLCEEMQEYINSLYGHKPTDRIFPITKSYLHHEMNRGCKAQGVKRIRIHDLRHSHVSLLIDMGFSAVAIADRVGHESIDITYRYAHLFPSKHSEIAEKLDVERIQKEDEKLCR
jgi:integrase